jgi:DNA-directed RNA polymerase subunit alpha
MAVTRIPLPYSDEPGRLAARLEMSLAELGLTARTVNALEQQEIHTVRQLLQCTRQQILRIPNFGEKTLQDILAKLAKAGFSQGPRDRAK